MKNINLAFIILFFFQITCQAQLHDSTLIKKLTVNGVCLCQTTLPILKQSYPDLKETDIEEMDLAKGCYGQDSRFISGTGYFSRSQPGLIFQKEQDSDFISKIRLNKQFKGSLPDDNIVDLSSFKLSDLFKLYPQFKNNWQSRGCSDYWKFSNDTISFYVKIDKTKVPQFPIDQAYYLDKPIEAIDLTISCSAVKAYDEGYHLADRDTVPLFFVDSVRMPGGDLSKLNPDSVAIVRVIKDTVALRKFGPDGKNGLVYIETKQFAKKRYIKYFTSKSKEYSKIVGSPAKDDAIQYIFNKKVLKENFEGDLALIDDNNFIEIQILSKTQLMADYGITGKDYGVVIRSVVSNRRHK